MSLVLPSFPFLPAIYKNTNHNQFPLSSFEFCLSFHSRYCDWDTRECEWSTEFNELCETDYKMKQKCHWTYLPAISTRRQITISSLLAPVIVFFTSLPPYTSVCVYIVNILKQYLFGLCTATQLRNSQWPETNLHSVQNFCNFFHLLKASWENHRNGIYGESQKCYERKHVILKFK